MTHDTNTTVTKHNLRATYEFLSHLSAERAFRCFNLAGELVPASLLSAIQVYRTTYGDGLIPLAEHIPDGMDPESAADRQAIINWQIDLIGQTDAMRHQLRELMRALGVQRAANQ
jgi:hypothetical protein